MPYVCENCGKNEISSEQFEFLANDLFYLLDDDYNIIEKSCEASMRSQFDNFEIIQSTEDLLLVLAWDGE